MYINNISNNHIKLFPNLILNNIENKLWVISLIAQNKGCQTGGLLFIYVLWEKENR